MTPYWINAVYITSVAQFWSFKDDCEYQIRHCEKFECTTTHLYIITIDIFLFVFINICSFKSTFSHLNFVRLRMGMEFSFELWKSISVYLSLSFLSFRYPMLRFECELKSTKSLFERVNIIHFYVRSALHNNKWARSAIPTIFSAFIRGALNVHSFLRTFSLTRIHDIFVSMALYKLFSIQFHYHRSKLNREENHYQIIMYSFCLLLHISFGLRHT